MFGNKATFYGEELSPPRPTPKLEDHPLPAVRDCLLNIFAVTLRVRRQFLYPQPEDAPCRGDRDPPIAVCMQYDQRRARQKSVAVIPTVGVA